MRAVITDLQAADRVPRRRRWPLGRALLLAVLAVSIGWGLAGGAGASPASVAAATVVVAPGDTVWGIAARHPAGGDIRDEVARILAANRLSSPVIQPGEILVLPAG